jgi:glucose/arabinose dehydrogenase
MEARTVQACSGTPQPNAELLPGFCSQVLPVTVQEPRTIVAVRNSSNSNSSGGLLVLERETASIVLLSPSSDNNSLPDTYRKIATLSGLNHGLAVDFDRELLYASTADTVYRWTVNVLGGPQLQPWTVVSGPVAVVTNLSANGKGSSSAGGHVTRSLVLDPTGGFLFVSVGAAGNVDHDSYRSRVRKVDVRDPAAFPVDFTMAPVHADGLRNEVGLAWDAAGTLWGVENGPDNLFRSDLGGAIHQDNPAEELNRLDGSNKHYGYPYCWTEYSLPAGLGRGTVWAWPANQLGSVTYTDAQCRNTSRFQPPEVAMQGHSAPLGIVYYKHVPESERPAGCGSGAFPAWMDGYAFIAFHGSWNRDIPTGYKVVYVEMKDGRATSEPIDLLKHGGSGAAWPDGFRPVSVDFDACGRLYVSSDGSGSGSKVVRIEHVGAPSPSSAPASAKCRNRSKACGGGAPCCGRLKCVKATTTGTRRVCKLCRSSGQKCQPGWCCRGLVCAKRAQNGVRRCRPKASRSVALSTSMASARDTHIVVSVAAILTLLTCAFE